MVESTDSFSHIQSTSGEQLTPQKEVFFLYFLIPKLKWEFEKTC